MPLKKGDCVKSFGLPSPDEFKSPLILPKNRCRPDLKIAANEQDALGDLSTLARPFGGRYLNWIIAKIVNKERAARRLSRFVNLG